MSTDKLSESILKKRRMIIASRLRDIMLEQNMTKRELAGRLKKDESYTGKLLAGDINLTLRTLSEIEASLHTTLLIDERFYLPDKPTPEPTAKAKRKRPVQAGLLRLGTYFQSPSNLSFAVS